MRNYTLIIALFAAFTMVGCGTKQQQTVSETPENQKMQYRELGSTGIQVAELGLGCGAFGELDSTGSRAFMDVALANGMNYIDIYDSDPMVRSNIGYALQGRRDQMIIQGHLGSYFKDGQHTRTRDLEETKAGFADLLERLGTDHIEVGMIHICDKPEDWTAVEGSDFLAYLQQLKEEGKIGHIGMSSHNAEVALMAAKSGIVEVIMFSLNPAFDRIAAGNNMWDPESYNHMLAGIDPVRMELYDYCATHNIAITVMKAFGGGGHLLDAESSPLDVALTPSQCLSYALAKPCVAVALCGAQTIEELESDLHYLDATEEEKDYNAVLKGEQPTAVTVGDAECTYCNHCSPCPAGIDIPKVNQLLDEAKKYEKVPDELMAEYNALHHHASECIECGACETRCPFSVPVRDRMKEAVKVFGK